MNNNIPPTRRSLRSAPLLPALLWLWLMLAPATTNAAFLLQTLVDSDNDAATGCIVATAAGPVTGIDYATTTRVDLGVVPPVGPVVQERGTLGALAADPGFAPLPPAQWALGVGAAGGTVDVVETYARVPAAPAGARLAFAARTDDASWAPTALVTRNGALGGPPVVIPGPGAPFGVPLDNPLAIALLALVLATLAVRGLARHRHAPGAAALLLALVAGLAWAVIARDGNPADWGAIPPAAQDTTPALPGTLHFDAVYARQEGGVLNVRFDLDLGIRPPAAVADGPYAVAQSATLSVAAPGLLANDLPGQPAAVVREFRLAGGGPAQPAGSTVAFAGGTLTVHASGAFTVNSPALTGSPAFDYHLGNGLAAGSWATATVNVTPSATCGNGMKEVGEACDDGNSITEFTCPYGTTSCIACNATCTATLNLSGPYCGDNAVSHGEVCDDSNSITEFTCPYGTPNCIACNATCTSILNLSGPYCGDNVASHGEICDDGNNIDEAACPYGTANCVTCNASCSGTLNLTGPFCGDGVKNGLEQCDPNDGGGPACKPDCTLL